MRTRVLMMVVVMASASAGYAAEPIRRDDVQETIGASYVARYVTRLNIIVWPDGGGLEADPDIGMPAMNPGDPETPAATRRN